MRQLGEGQSSPYRLALLNQREYQIIEQGLLDKPQAHQALIPLGVGTHAAGKKQSQIMPGEAGYQMVQGLIAVDITIVENGDAHDRRP